MAMIKGITVMLVNQIQVGVDEFDNPLYEYQEEEIDNVLVSPSTSDDIATSLDLYGKKAVYTLAIPKGDTHNWENRTVRFWNQDWKTFGYPIQGIEANIPLDWNMKVMVERYG